MSEELNKPEWQVIGQLVSSIQIEQRRSRRWGIFFKSLTFVFLFSVLAIIMSGDDVETLSASQDHVAVVDIFGPIMTGAEASSERLL
ncbi:MAG: protease-4, partial [Oceanospirillaceae bacterium]